MHPNERNEQKRRLADAEVRHEEACRELMSRLKNLNGSFTRRTIRDLIPPVSSKSTNDELRAYIEEEIRFNAAIDACIARGWIGAAGKQGVDAHTNIDDSTPLKISLAGYRVKERGAPKPCDVPTVVVLNAKSQQTGTLKISCGPNELTLSGELAAAFEVLHIRSQDDEVATIEDLACGRVAARQLISRLRKAIRQHLELDADVVERGICTVPRAGYQLDSRVFMVRWTTNPGRQRRTVSADYLL